MNRYLFFVHNAPRQTLIGFVKAYRLLLSPWLGNACRFAPTCSAYSLQALEQHGAIAGTTLTLYRLARCQPWCQGGHDPGCAGGCDPVPPDAPRLFGRLLAPSSQKKSS